MEINHVFLALLLASAVIAVVYLIDYLTTKKSVSRVRKFVNDKRVQISKNIDDVSTETVILQKKMSIEDYMKTVGQMYIVQAYEKLLEDSPFRFVRKVKLDEHTPIRSLIVQMLIGNIGINRRWEKTELIKELEKQFDRNTKFHGCDFESFLKVNRKNKLWAMKQVLEILWTIFEDANTFNSNEKRENWIEHFVNASPVVDLIFLNSVFILAAVELSKSRFTEFRPSKKYRRSTRKYLEMLARGLGIKINLCVLDEVRPVFRLEKVVNNRSDFPEITLVSDSFDLKFDTIILDDDSRLFNPLPAGISKDGTELVDALKAFKFSPLKITRSYLHSAGKNQAASGKRKRKGDKAQVSDLKTDGKIVDCTNERVQRQPRSSSTFKNEGDRGKGERKTDESQVVVDGMRKRSTDRRTDVQPYFNRPKGLERHAKRYTPETDGASVDWQYSFSTRKIKTDLTSAKSESTGVAPAGVDTPETDGASVDWQYSFSTRKIKTDLTSGNKGDIAVVKAAEVDTPETDDDSIDRQYPLSTNKIENYLVRDSAFVKAAEVDTPETDDDSIDRQYPLSTNKIENYLVRDSAFVKAAGVDTPETDGASVDWQYSFSTRKLKTDLTSAKSESTGVASAWVDTPETDGASVDWQYSFSRRKIKTDSTSGNKGDSAFVKAAEVDTPETDEASVDRQYSFSTRKINNLVRTNSDSAVFKAAEARTRQNDDTGLISQPYFYPTRKPESDVQSDKSESNDSVFTHSDYQSEMIWEKPETMKSESFFRAFISDNAVDVLDTVSNQSVFLDARMLIADYMKGITDSKEMEAYESFLETTSFKFLRTLQVNKPFIGSVIVQMLIKNIHMENQWISKSKLITAMTYWYLKGSRFGSCKFDYFLRLAEKNKLWAIINMLGILWAVFDDARTFRSNSERENWIVQYINANPVLLYILVSATSAIFCLYLYERGSFPIGKTKRDVEMKIIAKACRVKIRMFALDGHQPVFRKIVYNNKSDLPTVNILRSGKKTVHLIFMSENVSVCDEPPTRLPVAVRETHHPLKSEELVKAFIKDKAISVSDRVCNQTLCLSPRLLIEDHVKNIKSTVVLQAYTKFQKDTSFKFLREVRSDSKYHYRTSIIQMLIDNIHIKRRWKSKSHQITTVAKLLAKGIDFSSCAFQSLLIINIDDELWAITKILDILWTICDDANSFVSNWERECWVEQYLNNNPVIEWILIIGLSVLVEIQYHTAYVFLQNPLNNPYLELLAMALRLKVSKFQIGFNEEHFYLEHYNDNMLPEISIIKDTLCRGLIFMNDNSEIFKPWSMLKTILESNLEPRKCN